MPIIDESGKKYDSVEEWAKEKIEPNLIERIKWNILWKFIRPINSFLRYDIKNGVRNLIVWFPIIWKDRDYDYVFLLSILSHKTKLMGDLHKHHGVAENSEETANELYRVSELAKTLAEEDFGIANSEERDRVSRELFRLMHRKLHSWWD